MSQQPPSFLSATSPTEIYNLPPLHPRSASVYSTFSADSRARLVQPVQPPEPKPATQESLPSFYDSGSREAIISPNPHPRNEPHKIDWKRVFRGWRLIILGSWLNLLLLLIPISWGITIALKNTHGVTFAASILALIPLVRLHDLSTRELAARIGGNRTGLLNGTMSNFVEVIVAISALRKCELQVVQSTLVGSMLSKMLLVLGLCFLAGGMRFSEQGFDATATQVHSSLLSLSVGAVLLPAAFHFTLNSEAIAESAEIQKRDILRMSRGVSIVLFFIYIAYLVFQFWSHTHLYHDDLNKKSSKLTTVIKEERSHRRRLASSMAGTDSHSDISKITTSASLNLSTSGSPRHRFMPPSPLANSTSAPDGPGGNLSASSGGIMMMNRSETSPISEKPTTPLESYGVSSTVRLIGDRKGALAREDSNFSGTSDATLSMAIDPDDPCAEKQKSPLGRPMPPRMVSSPLGSNGGNGYPDPDESFLHASQPYHHQHDPHYHQHHGHATLHHRKEPQLSWFLTILTLIIVTGAVAVTVDWLVESMDGISTTISKEWIGLILLPGISSIAECMTAVRVSVKDELSLSVSVAVGSTLQTALLILPFTVILAWITGKPLSLLMDPFQSMVLYIAVHTVGYVVADGKSNWLEGIILVCLYIIIAVSFWFYPGSDLPSSLAVCRI